MDVKNTKDLQLMALDVYMNELGYGRLSPVALTYYNTRYLVEDHSGMSRISFRTAVNLYNATWRYNKQVKAYQPCFNGCWLQTVVHFPMNLSAYDLAKLQSRKIVESVFLQSKKNKQIIVQKHQVKLVDPLYYDLFLG